MKILNTQFYIQTTLAEDSIINNCHKVIEGIISQMIAHNCNEMINHETGEVITLDEFKRMLGILGGLPYMTSMYFVED